MTLFYNIFIKYAAIHGFQNEISTNRMIKTDFDYHMFAEVQK